MGLDVEMKTAEPAAAPSPLIRKSECFSISLLSVPPSFSSCPGSSDVAAAIESRRESSA
jgi:hypothetical protein